MVDSILFSTLTSSVLNSLSLEASNSNLARILLQMEGFLLVYHFFHKMHISPAKVLKK